MTHEVWKNALEAELSALRTAAIADAAEIEQLRAEVERLKKACNQRAAHEYKLMGEIDALKAQNAELLAAQEGTPCKHEFNAVLGGVLSCTHCYASFSEQKKVIAKARGDL